MVERIVNMINMAKSELLILQKIINVVVWYGLNVLPSVWKAAGIYLEWFLLLVSRMVWDPKFLSQIKKLKIN